MTVLARLAILIALCAVGQAAADPIGERWTDIGRILEPSDFGRPSGSVIGDPTGVLLPDGRIRLFVFVDGAGVWRAVSRDATGTSFQVEGRCTLVPHAATNRLGTPWGMPRVVAIPGGLRMFYLQDGGIASAVSADSVTWTQEQGLRISARQAGFSSTTTGSIVELPGGGWRMYFSAGRRSPADPATPMKSAISPDMLHWTMDPGVRIDNATDPFVIASPDGGVTAWYFLQPASGSSYEDRTGLYVATSRDGLVFEASTFTGIPGGNPEVIIRRDGARLMYLSAADPVLGPGIRLVLLERD